MSATAHYYSALNLVKLVNTAEWWSPSTSGLEGSVWGLLCSAVVEQLAGICKALRCDPSPAALEDRAHEDTETAPFLRLTYTTLVHSTTTQHLLLCFFP